MVCGVEKDMVSVAKAKNINPNCGVRTEISLYGNEE